MKNIVSNISPVWFVFTLAVFALLVKLGLWQTQRANDKDMRLAHIQQLTSTKPFSLAELLKQRKEQELVSLNDLPVHLSGYFNSKWIFLLDNQFNRGQLGYRVYQLVHMPEGNLLINLGWVQGSIDRDILPEITPLEGHYTFDGHVRVLEKGILLEEQTLKVQQGKIRVQEIELIKFSQFISQDLLPFVVYLDKKEDIGYKKNWQPIVMPPEKHRGYAFQWFSLALAWLVLMVMALIKVSGPQKNKNNKNKV